MKKADIFWQTYLNLEREALEVSKYIFFTDEVLENRNGSIITQSRDTQLMVFSPYIADLLVRCCVQIEAISKELYFDYGGTKARGDSSIKFDEDCLKLIDKRWQTHTKTVMIVAPSFNFTKDENRILKPLNNAHKPKGTYWEKSYQAVKHDRYASLHKGNVKAFLHALAALYLLNIYYRNISWITSYQAISKGDYCLGSTIFSVAPPSVDDQLWYGNNPVISESPYIVKYLDSDYQCIEEMQQREFQALNKYWSVQPELQETDFLVQLQAAQGKNLDSANKINDFCELGAYRLKKKIPSTLSFVERKKLLIQSEEWNGWIHQHNNHLKADEINEDNIQNEIDTVGRLWGMELVKRYQPMEWITLAINNNICRVFIPN